MKNKFINTFVNTMYSILLGLGITNIIFNELSSLTNITIIVPMIFVIFVSIMYWWDWLEFVEDHITTTKIEFFIDFMIILTLVAMFGFYKNPIVLSVLLIVIAFLDLLWVLNYLYLQHSKEKVIHRDKKLWIIQKLCSLIAYGVIAILLSILDSEVPYTLMYFILLLAFGFVRYIGFSEFKKGSKLSITQANKDDLKGILAINRYHTKTHNESKGFLLGKMTKAYLNQLFEDEAYTLYVTKTNKDTVIAYILLKNHIDYDIVKDISITTNYALSDYLSNPYYYIEQIATHKQYQSRGIGKMLLDKVIQDHSETPFFSFVIQEPILNDKSNTFHLNYGFIPIGYFYQKEYMGLSNYKSTLYYYKNNTE